MPSPPNRHPFRLQVQPYTNLGQCGLLDLLDTADGYAKDFGDVSVGVQTGGWATHKNAPETAEAPVVYPDNRCYSSDKALFA